MDSEADRPWYPARNSAREWDLLMFPQLAVSPSGWAARFLEGLGFWIRRRCRAVPTIGNGTGYGNSGVGVILGPGQFDWDMSLVVKTTQNSGSLREDLLTDGL